MPFLESKSVEHSLRPIDNLALSGGGTKGLYHLGVFLALQHAGILQNIKRIAGTSIGSLMGLGIALGYTAEDLIAKILADQAKDKLLKYCDFIPEHSSSYFSVSDSDNVASRVGKSIFNASKSLLSAIHTGGILHGEHSEFSAKQCIKEKFPEKENLTFGELHQLKQEHPELNLKDFYVTAVNITDKKLEVFSWETTPDMPIPKAIQCSMAVPGLYKPVTYKGKTYVDGGVLCNLPVGLFDIKKCIDDSLSSDYVMNMRTLGVYLADKKRAKWMGGELKQDTPSNDQEYLLRFKRLQTTALNAVVNMVFYYQDMLHLIKSDSDRTVLLDTGKESFFNFHLSKDETVQIIEKASEWMRLYIEKYIKNVPDPHRNMALENKLVPVRSVLKFYSVFMPEQCEKVKATCSSMLERSFKR